MRISTLLAILSLVFSSAALAVDVSWPSRPVLGVIGASFATCLAPEDSPLQGVGLAGCSYEGLDVKLLKDPQLQRLDITVQSAAQGGARSYDIVGTGWLGYQSQFQKLVQRTSWFDGVQRLRYLLISTPNDCLHTLPCSEADRRDGLIANVQAVVEQAQAQGITVLVNAYPDWRDLDLAKAGAIYGITNLIDQADYETLKTLHEQVLSAIPGVVYLHLWQGNFDSPDGLHPGDRNLARAARKVGRVLRHLSGAATPR